MRLLLLGGPMFLGRALADAALQRGHQLTFFNRGQTNPELYPEVEKLRGDRDGELGDLDACEWDAVVDTSGYLPRVVRQSADVLADRVGRYCFVSSVSVYADFSGPVDESSAVGTIDDETVEEMGDEYENYGPLKAICERVVQETLGERSLVVRPGLIVGPHDPTGRFTYWPHRVARGGEVLAPGPPERLVQFIDVRDLGEWIVRLLEDERGGVFNATCGGVPWGDLLGDADVTWVDDAFLLEHGVGEWMGLPLWIAAAGWAGLHQVDVSRATAVGLRSRPVDETVRDTLALATPVAGVGLSPEHEAELLSAWHGR